MSHRPEESAVPIAHVDAIEAEAAREDIGCRLFVVIAPHGEISCYHERLLRPLLRHGVG
jgi:hypothetical protein